MVGTVKIVGTVYVFRVALGGRNGYPRKITEFK